MDSTDPRDAEAETLDPKDWAVFRNRAHAMLDTALDRLVSAREGPVWRAPDVDIEARFVADLPIAGRSAEAIDQDLTALLPFGVGNTHPRFFGWVHGSGTPSNLIADMVAGALNANLGGRHHGAILVERQVVDWCRQIFRFPVGASGLVVSGTSMATLIALKAARDRALEGASRTEGIRTADLVGYTSEESHSCIARAFDILGLGSDALRLIPSNDQFELRTDLLRDAIIEDRAAGRTPFALIGTAGTVNAGAIDDLAALADIAAAENVWLHVDGAFGACAMLSETLRQRLTGVDRADSLAFDFHKWFHVNYDAGMVLVRSEADHRAAFALRPNYLEGAEKGLAAGEPWPVDYGPELSRGFRALKVWAQLAEHGTEKLGRLIERNCAQARYLAERVTSEPLLELLAPVALNICCFRVYLEGLSEAELNALNAEIVLDLQEAGIAAPSTTQIGERLAIRVNLTNHRTQLSDLDLLVGSILERVARV